MLLLEGQMAGTPSRETISTRQQKLAALAMQEPQMAFTTLAHHVDFAWMAEAWRRTRKDGATGVDGMTSAQYAAEFDANVTALLDCFKSGRYRAPAVRRVHIRKPGQGNKTRPLGIPTLEDKLLQRAVLMVLEPVYEQDFLDCSFGFRPGRSAHHALEVLRDGLMAMGGGWVIDLDIEKFFDTVSKEHLRRFLDQRVRDGVIRRAIGKWLNAGVVESGSVSYPEHGTPQGGVISPLLSNIYLHEVLDRWFEYDVKPRLRGRAFEVRYADDAVLAFEYEDDARRVLAVLAKRFERFGLRLNQEKTRLEDFRRPSLHGQSRPPRGRSFDLLGFTHFWRRSRRGNWVIKRKTAKDRFGRALRAVSEWCRNHRHDSLADQCVALGRQLRGHYAYFGITGNATSLARFHHEVRSLWRKWLSHRSHRGYLTWERFTRLEIHYRLPPPRAVHSTFRRVATA